MVGTILYGGIVVQNTDIAVILGEFFVAFDAGTPFFLLFLAVHALDNCDLLWIHFVLFLRSKLIVIEDFIMTHSTVVEFSITDIIVTLDLDSTLEVLTAKFPFRDR